MEDMNERDNGGRPTKYRAAFCKQAHKLCLLGATNKEMADFFEVSESTLHEWKVKYPRFSSAVKGGKLMADAEVAASFYRRANGYNFNEITFEKIDSKINLENLGIEDLTVDSYKKKIVTKHLPPDAGAALNWLKNRTDKWRDSKNIEIDYSKLTDEQLDTIIDKLKQSSNG